MQILNRTLLIHTKIIEVFRKVQAARVPDPVVYKIGD